MADIRGIIVNQSSHIHLPQLHLLPAKLFIIAVVAGDAFSLEDGILERGRNRLASLTPIEELVDKSLRHFGLPVLVLHVVLSKTESAKLSRNLLKKCGVKSDKACDAMAA
jgi:hypothetical protein